MEDGFRIVVVVVCFVVFLFLVGVGDLIGEMSIGTGLGVGVAIFVRFVVRVFKDGFGTVVVVFLFVVGVGDLTGLGAGVAILARFVVRIVAVGLRIVILVCFMVFLFLVGDFLVVGDFTVSAFIIWVKDFVWYFSARSLRKLNFKIFLSISLQWIIKTMGMPVDCRRISFKISLTGWIASVMRYFMSNVRCCSSNLKIPNGLTRLKN